MLFINNVNTATPRNHVHYMTILPYIITQCLMLSKGYCKYIGQYFCKRSHIQHEKRSTKVLGLCNYTQLKNILISVSQLYTAIYIIEHTQPLQKYMVGSVVANMHKHVTPENCHHLTASHAHNLPYLVSLPLYHPYRFIFYLLVSFFLYTCA